MSKTLSWVFSNLQVCFFKYLKRGEAKIFPMYFENCKYKFSKSWEGDKQEHGPGCFKICKCALLNI